MGDANGGPGYGGYGGGYGYDGGYGGGYGYGGRPGPWNQPPGQSGTPYTQQASRDAQNLWSQYQGAQPGQGRDDLIRQMQGTDNGAAFNANMKNQGFVRTDSPGGNYSYSQPGGVSDQVRRMQEAQGLNNQGQPQTQQWSSQGSQGQPQTQLWPSQGGGGYQPGAWRASVASGGNGGYQPGAFGSWNGGSNGPMRERGYGQDSGWGNGQGGWGNGQGGWGNGQGGWGNGQGGGQPK